MTMHADFIEIDPGFSSMESIYREEYLTEKYSDQGRHDDVIYLADRMLNGLPINIKHYAFGYREYKISDLYDDVITHPLFQSAKAASDDGNKAILRDLIIRCARYAVARSSYDKATTIKLGFIE